jgi:hypothetical protein
MKREMPFDWIADNTRWMRKPRKFTSLEAALEHTAGHYRRDLWADTEAYVEIWIDKDALAARGRLWPGSGALLRFFGG